MYTAKNVLGGELEICGTDPMTGFYRNGKCNVTPEDGGVHGICCIVTEDFLIFSKETGNDLTTPIPAYGFPGLKDGDKWCVCAPRYKEALDSGYACPVVLKSTHQEVLQYVPLDELMKYAIDK